MSVFQSTPPRRGDRRWAFYLPIRKSFNPRPREGGDATCRRSTDAGASSFNPRPREGGDIAPAVACARHAEFQSTPPRRGRQWRAVDRRHACRVSIHAPAKGATPSLRDAATDHVEFQSTPPRRGRRSARDRTSMRVTCFNPRPREGGDRATLCRRARSRRSFNPRPREGGDLRQSLVTCTEP